MSLVIFFRTKNSIRNYSKKTTKVTCDTEYEIWGIEYGFILLKKWFLVEIDYNKIYLYRNNIIIFKTFVYQFVLFILSITWQNYIRLFWNSIRWNK